MTPSGAKGLPNVLDIRCIGLTGAIDLAPVQGGPGERVLPRARTRLLRCGIHDPPGRRHDRAAPPLIVSENEIGEIMDKVGASIKAAA